MIIEHHKNGQEIETYNIYNETDVVIQAKRCLNQLNLHPSVKGTVFGNPSGVLLTVDAGHDYHKFYISK